MVRDDRPTPYFRQPQSCRCCPAPQRLTVDFTLASAWPAQVGGGTTVCCLRENDDLYLGSYQREGAVSCGPLEEALVTIRREALVWTLEMAYVIFNPDCEIVGGGGGLIYDGPSRDGDPQGIYDRGDSESLAVTPGCVVP